MLAGGLYAEPAGSCGSLTLLTPSYDHESFVLLLQNATRAAAAAAVQGNRNGQTSLEAAVDEELAWERFAALSLDLCLCCSTLTERS